MAIHPFYSQRPKDDPLSNSEKRSKRLKEARDKGTHTVLEWELMKQFFGYECVRCGGESNLLHQVKDHIIPLYQGGSDSIKNIQPLCALCNCQKGPEDIDWRPIFCDKRGLTMPLKWLPE